jgi:hypothetical protein
MPNGKSRRRMFRSLLLLWREISIQIWIVSPSLGALLTFPG